MPLLGTDPARRDRPIRTGRRDRPIIQLPSVALRVGVVIGVAAVMFGIVFFRLWFLQILSGQEFVAQANDNRLKSVTIPALRGNIVDRNGEVLVTNRGGQLVGIRLMDVPAGALDHELDRLAPHLKMKAGELRDVITAYLRPSTMELQDVSVGDTLNQADVASATRSADDPSVIDIRTAAPLPGKPKVGSMAELSGLDPEAYDGLFTITGVTDASHFQVKLSRDPGEDARTSSGSTVAEKAWVSYLRWADVVSGKITGVDLIPLRQDVSRRIRTYLEEHTLDYPGVEVTDEYLRAYPHADMAAQVLGYVGPISAEDLKTRQFKGYEGGDIVGRSGLEWTYDRWLRGRDGLAKVEVDAQGHPKQGAQVPGGRMAEPGDTLVTTIDAKVQAAAEDAVVEGINLAHGDGWYDANGGAAVVLDVRNGDVLAMASYPTYDPKVWVGGITQKEYDRLFVGKSRNYPLLNRAISETKAVGSTFKAVTSIAALEEGVITTGTTEWCDGSYVAPQDLGETRFYCWAREGHGTLDLIGALTQSCDVYFYNVASQFYANRGTALEDWAMRLGFGELTGIDLPYEYPGRVPTPEWRRKYFKSDWDKQWRPGDSVNLAVGQGDLEGTPLQLAVAYAAVANGGEIVTPHLGLRIVDPAGKTVRSLEPAGPARKVDIAQDTLSAVRRGLFEAAHDPAGTSAPVFWNYGVQVSGKTGTAEVWDAQDNRMVDYAWYASYAPSDDPRYAVVVMIEKGGHGASTAAPATRSIYDSLFHLDSGSFSGQVHGD